MQCYLKNEILVDYKGAENIFKLKLIINEFSYKFSADINGKTILFEPDEERDYHSIFYCDDLDNNRNFDVEVLKKITQKIEELVR